MTAREQPWSNRGPRWRTALIPGFRRSLCALGKRRRRLGLVISIEQNAWSTVTVIPTSTSVQASVFRPEVAIAGRETKVLIDQILSVPKMVSP